MPSDTRIILAHQEALRLVRQQVRAYVAHEWGALTSWRDADIEAFARRVVPVVLRGERTVAGLTDAYLTSFTRLAGEAVAPVALASATRGVGPMDVYRRPGATVHAALSEGKPLKEAVALGLARAQSLAMTDLQLAQTHAARSRMSSSNVAGFRRVLTGMESCALCHLASTQRYHRGNLMPIHPGCDCSVAPIYGDSDPGQVINAEHAAAIEKRLAEAGHADTHGGTEGRKRDVTDIIIRDHGEYGPTLSWRGQQFTGPADL